MVSEFVPRLAGMSFDVVNLAVESGLNEFHDGDLDCVVVEGVVWCEGASGDVYVIE